MIEQVEQVLRDMRGQVPESALHYAHILERLTRDSAKRPAIEQALVVLLRKIAAMQEDIAEYAALVNER